MIIREANVKDIKQIQVVRNSVKENALSDPNLVTDADCEELSSKVPLAHTSIILLPDFSIVVY